jgi:outer membrane protein TolC
MIVNPGKMLLSVVASLTQPIFNKGRNVANLKIAQAQYEEAKVSFTQSLLDAGEEVNNALTQYQTAKRKQQIDSQEIDQLQEALQSTTLMEQNSNDTNYLDVLTARQSLLSGQLSQIEDLYSEIESVIRLYHALGGGVR